ncbi:2Fe-2S ferredoxin [Holospora obtusa F1]|uniref:2Fe-2S ferredoxin n=1 Tax=Holospora obtusa F1 TaxID=1399147 RepID=W6TTP6_HOLOB|nr:2Fe-2S iron-sulfur cluster-binding protein [Holospora obtusa]ETZ07162.1 2Fe-2S ferredoxin [Holospora obtusa F1]
MLSNKQSIKKNNVRIVFSNFSEKEVIVFGKVGQTIFEVFNDHRDILESQGIDLEGACGGACACATCHVIIQDETLFNLLPDASMQEEDMLDLAYDVRKTSRLGCQVTLTEDLDGIRVLCPTETRHLKI